jgi:hypothetical protein
MHSRFLVGSRDFWYFTVIAELFKDRRTERVAACNWLLEQ